MARPVGSGPTNQPAGCQGRGHGRGLPGILAQRSVPGEEGPGVARNQSPLLAPRISQPRHQEVSNYLSRPTGDSPKTKDKVGKHGQADGQTEGSCLPNLG